MKINPFEKQAYDLLLTYKPILIEQQKVFYLPAGHNKKKVIVDIYAEFEIDKKLIKTAWEIKGGVMLPIKLPGWIIDSLGRDVYNEMNKNYFKLKENNYRIWHVQENKEFWGQKWAIEGLLMEQHDIAYNVIPATKTAIENDIPILMEMIYGK